MATYGPSTLGLSIVLDEGPDSASKPTLRTVMAATTLAYGVLASGVSSWHAAACKRVNSTGPSARARRCVSNWLLVVLLINLFVHTFHYVDNILRPVQYFEPEWLYRERLFSPMELTFLFNFPMLAVGSAGAWQAHLMLSQPRPGDAQAHSGVHGSSAADGPATRAARPIALLWLYVAGALLTPMHYSVEWFSQYDAVTHFTIAGELLATIALAAVILQVKAVFHASPLRESSSGVQARDNAETALDLQHLLGQTHENASSGAIARTADVHDTKVDNSTELATVAGIVGAALDEHGTQADSTDESPKRTRRRSRRRQTDS